jgi:hypothetical protein
MSYETRLEWLIKMEAGARAERYGFFDAKLSVTVAQLFESEYETMRYQQGYEDGTAMLRGLSCTISPAMVVALDEEKKQS